MTVSGDLAQFAAEVTAWAYQVAQKLLAHPTSAGTAV